MKIKKTYSNNPSPLLVLLKSCWKFWDPNQLLLSFFFFHLYYLYDTFLIGIRVDKSMPHLNATCQRNTWIHQTKYIHLAFSTCVTCLWLLLSSLVLLSATKTQLITCNWNYLRSDKVCSHIIGFLLITQSNHLKASLSKGDKSFPIIRIYGW